MPNGCTSAADVSRVARTLLVDVRMCVHRYPPLLSDVLAFAAAFTHTHADAERPVCVRALCSVCVRCVRMCVCAFVGVRLLARRVGCEHDTALYQSHLATQRASHYPHGACANNTHEYVACSTPPTV